MIIKEQQLVYSRDDNEILRESSEYYDYTTVAAKVKTRKEFGANVLHESPCCAILHEVEEDFETIYIISKIRDKQN